MRVLALPLISLMLTAFAPGCSSSNFAGSSNSPAKPSTTGVAPKTDASGTSASVGAGAPAAVQAPVAATPVVTPPASAIVKGSFTIWAVPNHPAPGQDYALYCELTLPAGTTNYSAADLTGQITGTDGYRQAVGAAGKASHQRLQTNASSALLTVEVPGANPNVVDSMTVTSAVLNETQTTSLVFGF